MPIRLALTIVALLAYLGLQPILAQDRADEPAAPEEDAAEDVDATDVLTVTLTWEADDTDIDLSVWQPNGVRIWWNNTSVEHGVNGELVDDDGSATNPDDRDGEGPEVYRLRVAPDDVESERIPAGRYAIGVIFYDDTRAPDAGTPVSCRVTVAGTDEDGNDVAPEPLEFSIPYPEPAGDEAPMHIVAHVDLNSRGEVVRFDWVRDPVIYRVDEEMDSLDDAERLPTDDEAQD